MVDEGEFVMVATYVLIKMWFERCIVAYIRKVEVYVKADQIEGKEENHLPFEYEDHEYEESEKEAEEFSPNLAGYKGRTLKNALWAITKASTHEAFRKKMVEMAAIDEDTARNMDLATELIPLQAYDDNFEITYSHEEQYAMNLLEHTCPCRKWDLIGILCPHAIAAIWAKVEDLENYIDECYSEETYLRFYHLSME
ncbi:hypothetical protein ACH5RR_012523 [Cinchona calisaya]|uniref:SWIM-type domain-containing protein n=1 Tax=Cinchona calisaya TaxID=153742 RepID=A0ABD3ABK8_9GENT